VILVLTPFSKANSTALTARIPALHTGQSMAKEKIKSLVPPERIASRIYLIRGQKVMLDFDLAE
jgi:hypothetical protein